MDFYQMPPYDAWDDVREIRRRLEETERRLLILEALVKQMEDREGRKAMAYDDGRR